MSAGGDPRARPPDFDAMYSTDSDPWDVQSSWYEQRKLSVLLASLPREHYSSAWEPGCGPGYTSTALAGRVDSLVASDSSAVAVEAVRRRCQSLPHVRCVESALPQTPVGTPVELVVVAEFLYYVSDLEAALDTVFSSLEPGGHLALMHWAHHPHDAYRSGAEMQAHVSRDAQSRGAAQLVAHLDQDFLLDIFEMQP